VANRVRWTGFTDASQVSANLLAADCAVLPYREGASLRHGSLMAALAHGLPILTTETSPAVRAVGEVFPTLRDGENVRLVPPEEPTRMAAAVAEVMGDATLRARLASAALELSRQFDWDTIAQQHLQAYDQLG
jgi:glycosyltransferase involved in cell wall biosynthesis